MADERDDDQSGDDQLGSKGKEGSFGGQSSGRASDRRSSDGMSGEPIGGNDSNTGSGTTLTQGADFGQGTTSNAGGSTVGTSQTSGGSSGVSGGQGFILQQGSGSDDLRQDESAASAEATDGTDFAAQGRGATEEEDEERGGEG